MSQLLHRPRASYKKKPSITIRHKNPALSSFFNSLLLPLCLLQLSPASCLQRFARALECRTIFKIVEGSVRCQFDLHLSAMRLHGHCVQLCTHTCLILNVRIRSGADDAVFRTLHVYLSFENVHFGFKLEKKCNEKNLFAILTQVQK